MVDTLYHIKEAGVSYSCLWRTDASSRGGGGGGGGGFGVIFNVVRDKEELKTHILVVSYRGLRNAIVPQNWNAWQWNTLNTTSMVRPLRCNDSSPSSIEPPFL